MQHSAKKENTASGQIQETMPALFGHRSGTHSGYCSRRHPELKISLDKFDRIKIGTISNVCNYYRKKGEKSPSPFIAIPYPAGRFFSVFPHNTPFRPVFIETPPQIIAIFPSRDLTNRCMDLL